MSTEKDEMISSQSATIQLQERLLKFQKIKTSLLRVQVKADQLLYELKEADRGGWTPLDEQNVRLVVEQLEGLQHFIMSFTYQDETNVRW